MSVNTGPSALPPIDQALLPAEVRQGSAADKQDYQAALGFERMLVGELTKSMTATANPAGDGTDDGSDDSSTDSSSDSSGDDTSILSGTDAATSTYMQMLPDQLADSVMANGGLGLAQNLYDSMKASGK